MIATAPRNRMETNQDIGTDPLFFRAAHLEFGFVCDLAATAENRKCETYLGKGDGWLGKDETPGTESSGGSLVVPWHHWMGWLWLNPPFRDVAPWARKCAEEAALGAKVAMLVPAATDTDWFRESVWGKAEVRWLNSRLVFEYQYPPLDSKGRPHAKAGQWNTEPYPKPLMLCVFERGRFPRAEPWDWRACLPGRGVRK